MGPSDTSPAMPCNHCSPKYINIVEEMSIASGIPVPQMYIMEKEATINAFVAGYKPGESVVVITQERWKISPETSYKALSVMSSVTC